jgi:hypothetical protein
VGEESPRAERGSEVQLGSGVGADAGQALHSEGDGNIASGDAHDQWPITHAAIREVEEQDLK